MVIAKVFTMEVTERESTRLCHIFKSEQDLKMHIQNWGGGSLPKKLD